MPRWKCLTTWASTIRIIGLGAGIFFVSYVASCRFPGALLVERGVPAAASAVIMVAWGSSTSLSSTGLVHTAGQLYIRASGIGSRGGRLLPRHCGLFEPLVYCQDRRQSHGKRQLHGSDSLGRSFIGSPPAGMDYSGHHWLGFEGWRWLFALEGLPAILLGIVAFFYLTDWPVQAHWLRSQQRDWITCRLWKRRKPVSVGRVSIVASARLATGLCCWLRLRSCEYLRLLHHGVLVSYDSETSSLGLPNAAHRPGWARFPVSRRAWRRC